MQHQRLSRSFLLQPINGISGRMGVKLLSSEIIIFLGGLEGCEGERYPKKKIYSQGWHFDKRKESPIGTFTSSRAQTGIGRSTSGQRLRLASGF